MKESIYYVHAISAIHVGIGQGSGVIDLPLAREKASNLPQIPGSSIKGVLRDEMRDTLKQADESGYYALFGPDTTNVMSHAGAIAVGDARLLSLPVRSWKGSFAWTCCPMVLRRYWRDLSSTRTPGVPGDIPVPPDDNTALHADATALKDQNKTIYLEDLDFNAESGAQRWAAFIAEQIYPSDSICQDLMIERFLILPDSAFDFLTETATEIRSRIRIAEGTRTVQQGALWYEEYLPAETLCWGIVATDRSRKSEYTKSDADMLKLLPAAARIQIGGNATVGGGQARWLRNNV